MRVWRRWRLEGSRGYRIIDTHRLADRVLAIRAVHNWLTSQHVFADASRFLFSGQGKHDGVGEILLGDF